MFFVWQKVWPEACLGWAPGEDTGETKRGAEFAPLSYEAFDALPTPRLLKVRRALIWESKKETCMGAFHCVVGSFRT
jgi:hypothetical protein